MTISIVSPLRLRAAAIVNAEVAPQQGALPRDRAALLPEYEKACAAQIEQICAAHRHASVEEVIDL